MKKRLFVVLAVLALTVCLLPMVVGAETAYYYQQGGNNNHKVFAEPEVEGGSRTYIETVSCTNNCLKPCICGRPATEHKSETIPAVDPTCTEPGSTAGVKCTNANCPVGILTAPEAVPAKGHAIRYSNQKADGSAHYKVCDNKCGIDDWEAHEFGTSCTSKCVCGKQKVEAGHTWRTLEAKAATCTATGLTEGKDCSVCGHVEVAQEETPMIPHDYEDATCTEPGKCSCGAIDPDHAEPLGHTVGSGIIQNTNGTTHSYTCGRCQQNVRENHVYVGATCKVEGRCICLKTGILSHTPVVDAAVAPKCEATGLTEGSHCGSCGDILVAQEVVPVLGHKWDEGKITKQATYYETGIKLFTCQNDASHTYEEATPVLKWVADPNLDRVPRTGNAFIEWLYNLIFA